MTRNTKTTSSAVNLVIFLVVSAVSTVLIATTIQPFGASDRAPYRAVFSDASRLKSGDQVRVAGVVSGTVTEVTVNEDAQAVVQFSVDEDLELTEGTRAQVKYLNLVGDRYLALTAGEGGSLEPGGTIPLERTTPALDLDDLLNGFKPLFAALSPDDVNQLSYEIIATLQGEGPTVNELLEHTASLTSTLADRDVVIGRVVTNLNEVLGTLDAGEVELEALVTELTRFMGGLAEDRRAIGASIVEIDTMAEVTAALLRDARPALRTDVAELHRLAAALDEPAGRQVLLRILRTMPGKLQRITRSGSYGSWFNFYMCDVRVNLDPSREPSPLDFLFDELAKVSAHDASERCSG